MHFVGKHGLEVEFVLEDGDGGKGAAVFGTRSVLMEGGEVGFGAVGFVFGKAVVREALVEFEAEVVTGDLGHDGGAGNKEASRIAFHDGLVFDG